MILSPIERAASPRQQSFGQSRDRAKRKFPFLLSDDIGISRR
jgi:hypothetical protein